MRHSQSGKRATQYLRDGAQVDVERIFGRIAAGRVPDQGRSTAEGDADQISRPLSDVELYCGDALR